MTLSGFVFNFDKEHTAGGPVSRGCPLPLGTWSYLYYFFLGGGGCRLRCFEFVFRLKGFLRWLTLSVIVIFFIWSLVWNGIVKQHHVIASDSVSSLLFIQVTLDGSNFDLSKFFISLSKTCVPLYTFYCFF